MGGFVQGIADRIEEVGAKLFEIVNIVEGKPELLDNMNVTMELDELYETVSDAFVKLKALTGNKEE